MKLLTPVEIKVRLFITIRQSQSVHHVKCDKFTEGVNTSFVTVHDLKGRLVPVGHFLRRWEGDFFNNALNILYFELP